MEILWLVIAVGLGFAFVAMFGSAFVESLGSYEWTRVRGRITSSWVSRHTSTEGAAFVPARELGQLVRGGGWAGAGCVRGRPVVTLPTVNHG